MLIRFLRYLLGWVNFRVSGEFPERFLNQLALNGVSVWGLKRRQTHIEASVAVRDYLKFHRLKAKNRIVTRIISRNGLPFLCKKYRLRPGLAAGAVIYFVLLFVLSSFVWNIRIVGNQTIETKEILAVCEELGLKEGVRRSQLDPEVLRAKLALRLDGIAWASVNIEGVRATVNISESDGSKKDQLSPCNLVAEYDGIITAVEVTAGTIAVRVGQTVKKGDLLVSGITEYKDGTYRFGASKGKIIAETERQLTCFVPFSQSKTVRKGETVTRRAVTFFGLDIPLYLGSVDGPYETETCQKRFEKDGMYLPLILTETVFYKTETVRVTLSEEEARQKAEEELLELEKNELRDAEILTRSVEFEVKEDGVFIICAYKCRQNIAKTDLLLILEEK